MAFVGSELAKPETDPRIVQQAVDAWRPTTGEVIGANVDDALTGKYTSVGLGNYLRSVAQKGSPLTPDDWQKSNYFRPGLSYVEGMTDDSARIMAEQHDANESRDFIMGRASGWQTVAGMGAGIVAGIGEPLNVASGFGASLLLKPLGIAIPAIQRMKDMAQVSRTAGNVAKVAAVEGAIGAALVEPVGWAYSEQMQQDYGLADVMTNLVTSTAFSAGLESIGPAFTRARTSKAERVYQDTFNDVAAQMVAGKIPNIETASAYHQAGEVQHTRMEFETLSNQRRQLEDTLTQAERDNLYVHDEIARLEGEANFAEFGLRADELPDDIDPVEVLAAARSLADSTRGAITATENQKFLTEIRRLGGLKEESGELAMMGVTGKGRILNNKSGLSHDEMALQLWERGFLGTPDGERPTVNELRNRLADALRNNEPDTDTRTNADAAEAFLHANGIEINPNPASAAEIRAEAARLRSEVKGDDVLAPIRQQLTDTEARLRGFPPDAELAARANKMVNDTLDSENPLLYPDEEFPDLPTLDADEEIVRLHDEELAAWTSSGDELPAEYRVANEELARAKKQAEATFLCMTGR